MNSTKARRYHIALAGVALAGVCSGAALAAGVSEHAVDGMDHWYGRSGGPAPSDSVGAAHVPQQGGKTLEVGVPANSGSLLYNDAGGGIRSQPSMRSNEKSIQIGVPANSGSLLYNEAGGGIRSKPSMRSLGQKETQQPRASLQQGAPALHKAQ